MASFLLCVLQYVLEAVVILALGLCGATIGIKLRKNKNAKNADSSAEK